MFSVGDKVEVIDELISGVVTKITSKEVCIETSEGISLTFAPSELVKTDLNASVPYHRAMYVEPKEEKKKKNTAPKGQKSRKKPTYHMEIDLHIEKLVAHTHGMTNFDMLNTQLEEAQRCIEYAIEKGVPSIVFIHGVGEGVLKAELETLFSRYDLSYQDADYMRYGIGATEVFLQNIF
jgi:smr domain protein-possibly involved in DNA repair